MIGKKLNWCVVMFLMVTVSASAETAVLDHFDGDLSNWTVTAGSSVSIGTAASRVSMTTGYLDGYGEGYIHSNLAADNAELMVFESDFVYGSFNGERQYLDIGLTATAPGNGYWTSDTFHLSVGPSRDSMYLNVYDDGVVTSHQLLYFEFITIGNVIHAKMTVDTVNLTVSITMTDVTANLHIGTLSFTYPSTVASTSWYPFYRTVWKSVTDGVTEVDSISLKPQISVTGTAQLEGYTGLAGIPIMARVQLLQNNVVVRTDNVTLDAAGQFTLSNVDKGTYDVAVKTYANLQTKVTKNSNGGSIDLGTVPLASGDCDGDNEITSTDLSIILSNMDKVGD